MRKKRLFLCVLSIVLFTTGCVEDIDKSNRYTFTGQTVADYLEKHDDVFSDFIYILKRSGRLSLLKAYGTYTCFAPTNDAVRRYLVQQDSIWRTSLLPDSRQEIWTGITSPVLEELSDSMCNVISGSHILPHTLLSMDMEGDVMPSMNLNNRYLTLTFGTDENLHMTLFVNGALMVSSDNEVENGVVHVIADVLNPSSRTVPTEIEKMPFLSIFSDALKKTGLDDRLQPYIDNDYIKKKDTDVDDRRFGFTAFCESNEVFYRYDIHNVDELYARCKEWYPEATDENMESEDNALWRFVAYHLLDRKLLYTRMVCYNISVWINGTYIYDSETNFSSRVDRKEYYETMQGTLLKVVRPLSSDVYGNVEGRRLSYSNQVLLNYSVDAINKADPFHCSVNGIPLNVRVLNPLDVADDTERYPNFTQEALNGSIHILDDLLLYNEDLMKGYVLNEIIRVDALGMIPELINNNIRWSGDRYSRITTRDGLSIPDGYSSHLKYISEGLSFNLASPDHRFQRYQGDFCIISNNPDVAFRLPHVPAGTYEIRLGFVGFPDFGVVQIYVDDEPTGIPIDMGIYNDHPIVGWILDSDTDDNGVANDKQMKNRGYYKAPTSYMCNNGTIRARDSYLPRRNVITTKYLNSGDHWVRFKSLTENGMLEIDYFEIVPIGWMRNENISLEDRRK